jgi:protein SCO1/2
MQTRTAVFFTFVSVAAVVCWVIGMPAVVHAQKMTGSPSAAGYRLEPGQPSTTLPAALREIGFDQNIDQHVPLDTAFTDETGRAVRLGEYFGKRPVVMIFAYYECPMLCTQVINGLASALSVISLKPGDDYDVVVVSFDPKDTPASAAARKAVFVERYGRGDAAAGSHFLSGRQDEITRLTNAAGFRYVWDEQTSQFAHPSGVIVLTPDGRLARYLFGIEYGPRDLRFGIVEASNGKVGNPADALLLYCYHYDPMTGRYGLVIMRALRLAGIATVLALGIFIVVMVRREKRTSAPTAPDIPHAARGTR